MHETLDLLIREFRAAQDIGVSTLARELGIPQPDSGIGWVRYCHEQNLYDIEDLNGVGVYAHGYGVELRIGALTIDFDWGDHGEPDGFDGWRLYTFAIENLTEVMCSHSDVDTWLAGALAERELTKVGSLYFDPRRRATLAEK